ncbi:hypothetical protein FGKAn22_21350 [Ferrigenium kumadai]|uniref:Cobalamin ABC transporter n=1 Tax=Ferrigenium kumadai TaxID=1682490 RepID=A0AAN1W178_9PROT|nr:hypothetical protein [Ferrigenium kumadai]BBJ00443.1 hypothetical protein FGKAn22_21350 [Ferrigenium kumadai]
MFSLSKRNTTVLVVALSAVMWATRGHHLATTTHLPDASWAIFFLLGFYAARRSLLPLFLAQAAVIDYLAITHFGVSDFCVTPAYALLLPAYSVLWLAGRWYAARYQFNLRTLPLFAGAATVGISACELISSGGFYFLGGRFAEPTLAEFGSRLAQYFPYSLGNAALYLGCAALIHVALVISQRQASTAAQ